MNIYKKIIIKKKVLFFILIFVFIFIFLLLYYKLKLSKNDVTITKIQFEKNESLENYDNFTSKVNYALYRQGNPEQIYIAENPNLPFSEIETYTSSLFLDRSLENVDNINDINVKCFPENEYSILYSEQEIAINRENDDTEITLYFTNKTGSTSYPDFGNAIFSKCENISIIIFKANENLYCSAVGRNISISDLLELIQSLNADVSI